MGKTSRQSEEYEVFLDCCSHAWGVSKDSPVLFWTKASRIPHQRCGHSCPSPSWKPVKNLEKTPSFLSVCIRFCTSQGLNLCPEGLSPFSVAVMLIQVVTLIYTELPSYSAIMLSKKIHWKCANKNYNKGQLSYFFSDLFTQRTL